MSKLVSDIRTKGVKRQNRYERIIKHEGQVAACMMTGSGIVEERMGACEVVKKGKLFGYSPEQFFEAVPTQPGLMKNVK